MRKLIFLITILALISFGIMGVLPASADPGKSTRIADPNEHAWTGPDSYPYRPKAEMILEELDIQSGDVVVDIGAGDGWWTERIAKHVGAKGVLYALEVEQKKVDKLKEKYGETIQIKPFLSPRDSTDLPENSCDLVFLSQVYHHLDPNGQVDYLNQLRQVAKPTGRLVVIEKYSEVIARSSHGTRLSQLIEQAEEAGWVPVRYELLTGTYHYLSIFAQKELFPPKPKKDKKKDKPVGSKKRTDSGHTTDDLKMVKKNLANKHAVLVDVREQNEWDAGHLKQAVLLPLSQLRSNAETDGFAEKIVGKIPKGKIVYSHCRSGRRARVAAKLLESLGYEVRPLKAGYEKLLKGGFDKE